MSDKHTTPDGVERRLGCKIPQYRPMGFTSFADAPGITVLTLDQIKAKVAEQKGLNYFNRRTVFGPDWISDQHSTGACNGHSCAGALARTNYVRTGVKTLLSGADAYSQMNGGVDDGSALADGMKVIQTSGIARADLVPWNHIFSNQITADAKADRARHVGFELYAVDDEPQLASGILYGFMGVVAVHVQNGYDQMDADGISRGGNGPGNHSVCVDDVGISSSGELCYDQPNSWSPSWGQQGRIRLAWARQLQTTVKYHRFFLLRSTVDDRQGDNPPPATD